MACRVIVIVDVSHDSGVVSCSSLEACLENEFAVQKQS